MFKNSLIGTAITRYDDYAICSRRASAPDNSEVNRE